MLKNPEILFNHFANVCFQTETGIANVTKLLKSLYIYLMIYIFKVTRITELNNTCQYPRLMDVSVCPILVSYTFNNYTAVFPITIQRPKVPVLSDPGNGENFHLLLSRCS